MDLSGVLKILEIFGYQVYRSQHSSRSERQAFYDDARHLQNWLKIRGVDFGALTEEQTAAVQAGKKRAKSMLDCLKDIGVSPERRR